MAPPTGVATWTWNWNWTCGAGEAPGVGAVPGGQEQGSGALPAGAAMPVVAQMPAPGAPAAGTGMLPAIAALPGMSVLPDFNMPALDDLPSMGGMPNLAFADGALDPIAFVPGLGSLIRDWAPIGVTGLDPLDIIPQPDPGEPAPPSRDRGAAKHAVGAHVAFGQAPAAPRTVAPARRRRVGARGRSTSRGPRCSAASRP